MQTSPVCEKQAFNILSTASEKEKKMAEEVERERAKNKICGRCKRKKEKYFVFLLPSAFHRSKTQ